MSARRSRPVRAIRTHRAVRWVRVQLLQATGDISVVGEVGNGNEALRRVPELNPDVVLMDIAMPELNGIDATLALTQKYPGTRIIIVSMHATSEHVHRALAASRKRSQ